MSGSYPEKPPSSPRLTRRPASKPPNITISIVKAVPRRVFRTSAAKHRAAADRKNPAYWARISFRPPASATVSPSARANCAGAVPLCQVVSRQNRVAATKVTVPKTRRIASLPSCIGYIGSNYRREDPAQKTAHCNQTTVRRIQWPGWGAGRKVSAMSEPAHAMPSRKWLWVAGVWSAGALFDATQTIFIMHAEGRYGSWLPLFLIELVLWLPWALATPLIVHLARRFPLFRGVTVRGVVVHLVTFFTVSAVVEAWC